MPHDIRLPAFLKSPALAACCLLVVASIRFNRNDLVVARPLNDAAYYISNVEKMRGVDPTTYAYKGPFNERILGTTLAALLPLDPLTAINVVNLIFLLAAVYFLFRLLLDSGISENLSWLGLYLFIFSFPTFYYSTIGYVDPTVLGCIFLGAWAIFSKKPLLYLAAVAAGAFAKENIVVLILPALAYAYSSGKAQWYVLGILGGLLVVLANFILRRHLSEINDYLIFWEPRAFRISDNFTRPNFYISTLLSWGIPLVACSYYLINRPREVLHRIKDDLPLWAGILTILGGSFYMFIAAFPDGRNVWVSYCFPLLLMLRWWQRWGPPFHMRQATKKP
jgi:hypothetical protein